MNFTSIFHIFSFLALVGLVVWLVREIKFRRNTTRLWRYVKVRDSYQPWVDWPDKFFQDYARLTNIEIELNAAWKRPVRIYPRPWLLFDQDFDIQLIHVDDPDIWRVTIAKPISEAELSHWQEALGQALGWKAARVLINKE